MLVSREIAFKMLKNACYEMGIYPKQEGIYVALICSKVTTLTFGFILGGGGLAYVVIRGCAIILGLLPDFWVPFGAIPRFLGIIFWLFPDFCVIFW